MTRKYAPAWQLHVTNYAFSLPYCYRKDVMDAGCQTGYGTNLIGHVAKSVISVDSSQECLRLTKELYKPHCPTEYLLCDFETDFPATLDGYDTVVAFELIEHLANPEFFLRNIAVYLRPGGKFVFSTPHMMPAKDHKQLFTKESIGDLVGKYLTIEKLFETRTALDGTPHYNNVVDIVGVASK